MNNELLKQYNLKFVKTKDIRGEIEFGVINTNGKGGVSEFLDDIIVSSEATELLSKVNLYLEGGEDPELNGFLDGRSCYGDIYNESVYIYSIAKSITGPIDIVPLKDFHDLVETWRAFLIQNGN
ncbi:hypothetical protein [Polluticaenibacter yanchengensis]|uniref:Uncharacterized protein n=1 Tax=Polluticaenibacter yanchengensis TaxID=3014562 RepID=A0ABT4UR80_9BACT|nr:hypothetical protein [Chitinophagaceae bacterium LY-5]